MKEYHVVLEGRNGFQKEEALNFPNDLPPSRYFIREYQQISFQPLSLHSFPMPDQLNCKERVFHKIASFYCCGRNIVYYREECC